MTEDEPDRQETDAQPENTEDSDFDIQTDLPRRTEHLPVTVTEEIEERARERHQKGIENGLVVSLEDYLLDHIDLDFQFLTRDVVNEKYGEPVTHAIHSMVTEEQYEEIVEASSEEGSVEAFVREAVLNELKRREDS